MGVEEDLHLNKETKTMPTFEAFKDGVKEILQKKVQNSLQLSFHCFQLKSRILKKVKVRPPLCKTSHVFKFPLPHPRPVCIVSLFILLSFSLQHPQTHSGSPAHSSRHNSSFSLVVMWEIISVNHV